MAEQYGYAGKILKVDLSSGKITSVPTMDYADRFLGGRGFAAKIYWDEVPPDAKALGPENCLIFATGPLAGFPGLFGSVWQLCGKSPAAIPEQFSYSSSAGSWGAQLKLAGYDALVVQGKSDKPVYLRIEDGTAEIRDASALWGKGTFAVRDLLKGELGSSVRVVACGPAGENMVTFASTLADDDACATGGMGAVMGSKNLKAVAVRGRSRPIAANPEKVRELSRYARRLTEQDFKVIDAAPFYMETKGLKMKKHICFGCIGCNRTIYEAKDGKKGKFWCESALMYEIRSLRYYGEWTDVPFYAAKLCDDYGLDTWSVETMMMWLVRCNRAGILTDENTGIPLSKLGSLEFIETLVKKISLRDGFGDVLAQGTLQASEQVGKEARELITDYIPTSGQHMTYCPRMFITTGVLYAMEPRTPIQQLHEITTTLMEWVKWANKDEGSHVSSEVFRKLARRFWGSELAADFSTYEGKALAAKKIQDRQYAKESLILCDRLWPIKLSKATEDHMGDPTIESQVLSAVTGNEVTEEGLYRIGERVFNMQRAVLVREGRRGRESDKLPEAFYTVPLKIQVLNPECLAPGKDGEVISRKGAVVDREKFEGLMSEYYQLRGWDVASGLQTKTKLEELDLQDVAKDLEQRGLVV